VRRRLLTGLLVVVAIVTVVLAVRSWATDETDRARAAVERFAAAVEDRDYATVCDRLLDARLRERLQAVDLPCVEALRTGLGDVREPRLTVENVVVVEDRARAAVRTAAAGQPASEDVLSLVRQGGAWRISALANENAGGTVAPAAVPEGEGPADAAATSTGAAPPPTVITTPTPAAPGTLAPKPSGLPDDEAIQDKRRGDRTDAEVRRDRRLRALQRRALREQGRRGE
jgi:hypothetical protein